jgi:hypothetical protein
MTFFYDGMFRGRSMKGFNYRGTTSTIRCQLGRKFLLSSPLLFGHSTGEIFRTPLSFKFIRSAFVWWDEKLLMNHKISWLFFSLFFLIPFAFHRRCFTRERENFHTRGVLLGCENWENIFKQKHLIKFKIISPE